MIGTDQSRLWAALGPCDGTPEWWRMWTDAITRAPAFDDEDTDGFAERRGLDKAAVRECFSPYFNSARMVVRDPVTGLGTPTGPLVRSQYRREPDAAPTDSCQYAGGACNGSCWSER